MYTRPSARLSSLYDQEIRSASSAARARSAHCARSARSDRRAARASGPRASWGPRSTPRRRRGQRRRAAWPSSRPRGRGSRRRAPRWGSRAERARGQDAAVGHAIVAFRADVDVGAWARSPAACVVDRRAAPRTAAGRDRDDRAGGVHVQHPFPHLVGVDRDRAAGDDPAAHRSLPAADRGSQSAWRDSTALESWIPRRHDGWCSSLYSRLRAAWDGTLATLAARFPFPGRSASFCEQKRRPPRARRGRRRQGTRPDDPARRQGAPRWPPPPSPY